MFARELQGACNVVGVGLADEIEKIKSRKIKIVRGNGAPAALDAKTIVSEDFGITIKSNPPDFLCVAARNPVDKVVEFYYRHFADAKNVPALILSQNGLSAIEDARRGLQKALGQDADKVQIIRVSLINGIDLEVKAASASVSAGQDGTSIIKYKLPIKLGFGAAGEDSKSKCKVDKVAPCRLQQGTTLGEGEALHKQGTTLGGVGNLKKVFDKAGIEAREFRAKEVLAMENAKLFLNLIGMACAVEGVDVGAGWQNKEIFKKEIAMLKEFAAAVKKSGGGFADNLGGYPVKLFASLVFLPIWLLSPFRGFFAKVIAKGRNRPKDLSEIDYYNGEVVRLGKRGGAATPINREIIQKSKESKSNYK